MIDEQPCRFAEVCPFVKEDHKDQVRSQVVPIIETMRRVFKGCQLGKDRGIMERDGVPPDKCVCHGNRFEVQRTGRRGEWECAECGRPVAKVIRGVYEIELFKGWKWRDIWWQKDDMRVWSRQVGVGDSRIAVEQWYSEKGVTEKQNGPFDTLREAIDAVERSS